MEPYVSSEFSRGESGCSSSGRLVFPFLREGSMGSPVSAMHDLVCSTSEFALSGEGTSASVCEFDEARNRWEVTRLSSAVYKLSASFGVAWKYKWQVGLKGAID